MIVTMTNRTELTHENDSDNNFCNDHDDGYDSGSNVRDDDHNECFESL